MSTYLSGWNKTSGNDARVFDDSHKVNLIRPYKHIQACLGQIGCKVFQVGEGQIKSKILTKLGRDTSLVVTAP